MSMPLRLPVSEKPVTILPVVGHSHSIVSSPPCAAGDDFDSGGLTSIFGSTLGSNFGSARATAAGSAGAGGDGATAAGGVVDTSGGAADGSATGGGGGGAFD